MMRKSVRSGDTAGFASLGSVGRIAEEGSESDKAVGEIKDVFERLGIDVGEIGGSEGLGLGGGEDPIGGMYGERDRESDEDVEQHSSEEEIEDEEAEGR